MVLRHLPEAGYDTRPWKNGQGVTDEVLLLPEGAGRAGFDLRISRARIDARGLFSAFPGADRIITVIEGAGLRLEFGDRSVTLDPLEPFGFDTGLTPDGIPLGQGVRVFNVMAAREAWVLGPARVLRGGAMDTDAALTVVFALGIGVRIGEAGAQLSPGPGDTALAGQGARIAGPALVIPLTPAPGRG
ncbi:HutD family protein [Rhodobacter sp. SGA-6-6]|uniref:HutD/Ves family protein n=1 Tax=Rhodobacter sp. SGA-6-6 TaxID=2710882 RepID=UPI0013EDF576|nr:HutD family protein [Rhodobacter sp. SGA-6-6]NGM47078.1 HutD family protein [Rhodobacter sp. SGA-6-6]